MEQVQDKGFRNVIWAVDAFSDDLVLEDRAASLIKILRQALASEIEPVSVLRPAIMDPYGRGYLEGANLSDRAEENLKAFMDHAQIPGILSLRFLTAEGNSMRLAVETLIDYAKENEADLIVLSTHARKGAPRLFMGSFAETLVVHSPIPVFVANPKLQAFEQVEKVIFPTDFSEPSKQAFTRTLQFAKALHAKILLYHRPVYPAANLGAPFVLPPVSQESLDLYYSEQRGIANDWAKVGQEKGVEVFVDLPRSRTDLVSGLVRTAKKTGGAIIAMASQSGPILSALLGTTTRKVLREAPCPVLVFHPSRKAKEHREPLQEAG